MDAQRPHSGPAAAEADQLAGEFERKAGTFSIIGVYSPEASTFPIGKAMNKNLTIRMGNCNHRKYIPRLVPCPPGRGRVPETPGQGPRCNKCCKFCFPSKGSVSSSTAAGHPGHNPGMTRPSRHLLAGERRPRLLHAAIVLACAWLQAACGGGGGGSGGGAPVFAPVTVAAPAASAPVAPVTPVSTPAAQSGSFTIESKAVFGVSYTMQVYVPPSYASDAAAYPVIYALDGDAEFNGRTSRYENFRAILERREAKAILVAIGGTGRRQTDYNFPGASDYHDFLVGELIPAVESRYRTDKTRRILTGLSTSGNIALGALFLEAPGKLAFTHFVSIEGAFWQQPADLQKLEQSMAEALAGGALPVTVMLGSCITGCNEPHVEGMYRRLASRQYQGLELIRTQYPGGHAQTDLPAFEDTVSRFLKSAR
ncbi:Esterase (modular protein) [Burkholderiales bacterium 8X]|nr:Esterase (modular protein) [Burkholderiales bacterium 8X]